MKKHTTLLVLALIFVLLLAGAYIVYDGLGQAAAPDQLAVQEQQTKTEEETPEDETERAEQDLAPDFTVYDEDGGEVHLSDFIGKPVVLNFWASWCGPCKMEMPDFHEKYQELGEDVQFLMINLTDGARETVDSALEFISEQGYTFPVLYDTDGDAGRTYGVNSIPTTYFIDAEGNIVTYAIGKISAETLQKGIDKIYSSGQ